MVELYQALNVAGTKFMRQNFADSAERIDVRPSNFDAYQFDTLQSITDSGCTPARWFGEITESETPDGVSSTKSLFSIVGGSGWDGKIEIIVVGLRLDNIG